MSNITVHTGDTLIDGQYRILGIDFNNVESNTNYVYHIMQILKLKGVPESIIDNSYLAYDFAFTFGG